MTKKGSTPEDKVERLLTHLKDGTLAKQLVQAHRTAGLSGSAAEGMKGVLRARLEQVRRQFDSTEV